MPKTKFQNVVFTLMMSFLMVYAMICYNISMNIGGMTNQVFLMAFHEMIIMWPAAFILEFFLVDHLAHKLAFCMVTPQDRPIAVSYTHLDVYKRQFLNGSDSFLHSTFLFFRLVRMGIALSFQVLSCFDLVEFIKDIII